MAGAGAERAALAMLRTLGGGRASLLVPQPVAASSQSGLGLSAPSASEVGLEPVLLRTKGLNTESRKLVASVAPCTVQKALDDLQATAGDESAVKRTLESSRLRMGEAEYRIVSVNAKWLGGTKLLYELEIEE